MPFYIALLRHGFPDLEWASHLLLSCCVIGSEWLVPPFFGCNPCLDITDDGLAALMDMNVFNDDFLLSLAPVLVECFHKPANPREIAPRQPNK